MDKTTHNRADVIGMGIFVAVATGLIAGLLYWMVGFTWGHWWFWPLATIGALLVLLLAFSGMAAVMERGRPKPTLRPTGIAPENWANPDKLTTP